jgi:hypothetical protein
VRALICFLTFALFALPAPAQTSGDMVGTWYGEAAINNSPYVDLQRWIRVNRPDGTQTVTFRFYRDNRLVAEEVRQDSWSLANGVYRSECRSMTINGKPARCDRLFEYDVLRLDAQQMEYTSRSSGAHYRVKRVPPDFKLP